MVPERLRIGNHQVEIHRIENPIAPWIAELATLDNLLRPLRPIAKDQRYNTLSSFSSFQLNRENVTAIAYRSIRTELPVSLLNGIYTEIYYAVYGFVIHVLDGIHIDAAAWNTRKNACIKINSRIDISFHH